jgi:hypothetical protein
MSCWFLTLASGGLSPLNMADLWTAVTIEATFRGMYTGPGFLEHGFPVICESREPGAGCPDRSTGGMTELGPQWHGRHLETMGFGSAR